MLTFEKHRVSTSVILRECNDFGPNETSPKRDNKNVVALQREQEREGIIILLDRC